MVKETKKKKKSPLTSLKKDFEVFNQHWKNMLDQEKLAANEELLHKVAEDIKNLNYDALTTNELSESQDMAARLILHLISTPWGAPFVSDKTLLEAALAYDYQNPLHSDLYHLVHDFARYDSRFNHELVSIFSSLSEVIREEEK